MGRPNDYSNGLLPKENGFRHSTVDRIGSMPDLSCSAKDCYDAELKQNGMEDESQRFLARTSGNSQDSGNSHSGSDDAARLSSKLFGFKQKTKRKKKDKDLKHAVEKAIPDRPSKGRKGWNFLAGKGAERSGPSESSPSASSPSKLSDSSDALADAADVGGSGLHSLKSGEAPSPAVLASARPDQAAEMVHSPPVASSGCLGMFMRAKSEDVTARGISQIALIADAKTDRKSTERLPPKSSRRSTETVPIAISNSSHASTSSAVSSRQSSFEELHAPAADSDTQAPQRSSTGLFGVRSPFAREANTSVAGQEAGKEGTADSAAGEEGRAYQSSDGAPAKKEQAEKKGHRRGHSLGSYLPSWVARRALSIPSNLDKAVEAHRDDDKAPPSPKTPRSHNGDADAAGPSAEAPAVPPKTPELNRNQSSLVGCFGLGKVAAGEDGDEEIETSKGSKGNEADAMPAGSVGLRNLGNTCFINSALQVLRWTPGFPELLVPDLLSGDAPPAPSAAPADEASTKAAPETAAPGSAAPEMAVPCSAVPATPSLLGPLAMASAEGGAQAAEGVLAASCALSGAGSDEDQPGCSAAKEDSAHVLNGSPVPPPLATIRENSPALAEADCLAPVRTKLPAEARFDDGAVEPAVSGAQHACAVIGTASQHQGTAAPGDKSEALSEIQTGQCARQGGSPLGPDTPAQCEPPFAPPSLGSSPNSLWGHISVHSDASTGSGQTVEEPRCDLGSDSKATPAEGLQAAAGAVPRVLQEAVCSCGMHAVARWVENSPATHPAAAASASKPMAPERKPPPLQRGEMAEAFRQLTRQVYSERPGGSVDPSELVKKLYQLPQGADFQDGGQHDCQEALRSILLGLHDDLNRVVRPEPGQKQPQAAPQEAGKEEAVQEGATQEEGDTEEATSKEEGKEGQEEGEEKGSSTEAEAEAAKADREWARHLALDNSVIYDLFSGQLQSSIKCHKCNRRFTTYEVFLDLSVPLTKEGKNSVFNVFSRGGIPSIDDCLKAFTTDEIMQGDEAFQCEHCNERTTATKHFHIHRLPKVLLIHIKRFKYTGTTREKITTNVTFPLRDLSLAPYLSDEIGSDEAAASKYDLFAVSNHLGSITNGHYMAVCKTPSAPGAKDKEQWFCYSDDSVKKLAAASVPSQHAYLLCYYRKDAEGK